MTAPPFFSIGHSDRSLDAFLGLLRGPRVGHLVDVRKFPRSRSNPQFNAETLSAALAGADISYEHLAALGGRRPRAPDVPPEVNGFWSNQSFHNYADYALSEPFRAGLRSLLAAGAAQPCAIMCAEAVWWRCHRRIVADYLIAAQRTVIHILGPGHEEPARLTPGAVVRADGTVVYPAGQERTTAWSDIQPDGTVR